MTNVSGLLLQGGPEMAPFLYALTLPNVNRFSKLFHCQDQEKIYYHLRSHHTSSVSLHSHTTLWNVKGTQNSVIWVPHVRLDERDVLTPQVRQCVPGSKWSVSSTDGLSTSTIHYNQSVEAGDQHKVGQTVAAFHWSHHWSVASARRRHKCVVQQGGHIEQLM